VLFGKERTVLCAFFFSILFIYKDASHVTIFFCYSQTKEQNPHNNIQVFYFSKSPYIIVLVFSIHVQNICSVKVHQCYIRFQNQPIRWILFLRFQLASIWTYIYRNGHLNYLNSWSNRTASFVFYKYTISSHFYPSMALCK